MPLWSKRQPKETTPENIPDVANMSMSIEDYYVRMHAAAQGYKKIRDEAKKGAKVPKKIEGLGMLHQLRLVNHIVRPDDGFEKMYLTEGEWADFATKRPDGLSKMDKALMIERLNHLSSVPKMMSYTRAMERLDQYLKTKPRRRIG